MEPQISVNKEAAAAEQTAGQISAASPRRALRGREDGGTNGAAAAAAADSVTGSGRVLRDRSARGIPVWRQTDVDEEPEELKRLPRRKAPCPRRKKPERPLLESEDDKDARGHQGARVKRTGVHSGVRPSRGSSKTACKVEPDADTDYVESSKAAVKTGSSADQKEECVDEEELLDEEEESPYVDDPKDRNYRPHSRSEEEESLSTDEDVTFRDQHNHRCCDDKCVCGAAGVSSSCCASVRESKRRHSSRLKEKEGEEKEEGGEEEKRSTPDGDPEIKTEGGHSATAQGDEPPRKRGRRRKDDKTPRMPKRRKKPPVQYVRCEMEGCGTVLAHPRYLQHHIKYQHLMKKKYVCPHPSCGRLFRLQKQLLRHAKHHTDQRDYICEFCARAFKSSHNLAVHRMIHTGEKPLQCEICGFTCRQKASLNWHMKKHDADASYQFSCGICGKKFEKKDSVVAHKAKSHPEVLIAEALAANAGALLTTPPGVTTLLEEGGVSSSLAPPPLLHLTFPQQLPADHGPALLPEAPPHCQSFAAQPPRSPRPSESRPVMWEGGGAAGNANGGGAWEAGGAGEGPDVTNSEAEIQCILLQ